LRFIVAAVSASLLALGAAAASAQNFPQKPVRIVTSGVGGAGDFAARLIGQALSPSLGQPVIVDNRASSFIPAEVVAKSPPDGHTLLLFGSAIWLAHFLWDNVRYDPYKDLAPITLAVTSPNVLVVHPSLPVKSVQELVKLAKAKPGQLNYGISSLGSSGSLAAELFRSMARVDMVRINYKAAGPALNDVIAGSVHLSFATATSAATHLKSGRLRALAVTSAKPSALFPGLPTVASAGLPGYESASTTGIFAPAGTPAPLLTRLSSEIIKVLHNPTVTERFMNAGSEIVAGPPEQLVALMKSDTARLGKVIRDTGMKEY
jgi:tripartite-type tricarboxylate transporter receptor subunit TctC